MTYRDEDIERLISEAVATAEYGLGRDGCPFCWRAVAHHDPECIALVLGAKDPEPGEQRVERVGKQVEGTEGTG